MIWVLFLLITALILVSAVSRKKNSYAESTSVEIVPLESGEKLLNDRDVRQSLLRAFGNTLEGTELANLEVERMERVLEEDPFVLDAETFVGQSNTLHVRIRQREPILRYLDKDAAKVPTSRNYTARVLVATGNIAPYTADFQEKKRNSLKDVFYLANYLMEDPVWSRFIQQIHVNNAGEFVLVPLIGDQKILLGSTRHLEDKLHRLKIFYKEGMPYAGWRTYETINLKYNGQVVAKR
jgi:cell division protein FtsQ